MLHIRVASANQLPGHLVTVNRTLTMYTNHITVLKLVVSSLRLTVYRQWRRNKQVIVTADVSDEMFSVRVESFIAI